MKKPRLTIRDKIDRALLAIVLLPFVLTFIFTFIPPFSSIMLQSLLAGHGVSRDWVPINRIAPAMLTATLAAEDARFCQHNGIDFKAVDASIEKNERSRKLHGASTITMQVAKNLFLWNGRNWVRKSLEAPLALWLELVWNKRRILEVYLNIAQWGDGRFGVEAAAQKAFHKPAAKLSAREAALLAAALPDLIDRHAGAPSAYHAGLANIIEIRMQQDPDATACVYRRLR
jgi:monofunctional biosynthetic peptidoglycan transglycosylase